MFLHESWNYAEMCRGIVQICEIPSSCCNFHQHDLHFSDGEVDEKPANNQSDNEDQEVAKKAGKKSKKSKSKAKAEESDSDGDDEPAKKPAPSKAKRETKTKPREDDSDDQLPSQPISAFALLQGDDSDDVGSGMKSDVEDQPAKKPAKQKKKSKKKGSGQR